MSRFYAAKEAFETGSETSDLAASVAPEQVFIGIKGFLVWGLWMKRQFYMLESSEQTVNILCFQVLDLLYSNMRLVPFPLQQVPFLRFYVFLDDGNPMAKFSFIIILLFHKDI